MGSYLIFQSDNNPKHTTSIPRRKHPVKHDQSQSGLPRDSVTTSVSCSQFFFLKQMQRLLLHYTKLIDDATPGDWSQQRHQ